MAAQITDVAIIATEVDAAFQRELLERAMPLCPYFIGSKPAKISEHNGTYVARWRRFENVTPTTTPLSELAGNASFPTRDSIVPSITDVTATVLKYGQYFVINEEVDLRSFTEENAEYAQVLGLSAGRSLNFLQRNEVDDNGTVQFGSGSTTTGVNAKITVDNIKLAVNTLQNNDALKFTEMTQGSRNISTVPQRPAFWGICHVDVEVTIRAATGFVPAEQYASQGEVAMGEFGSLQGVRFISTSDAEINAGGGATTGTDVRTTTNDADVYTTAIMGQNAVGSLGFGVQHIKSIYRAGDNLPAVQVIRHAAGSAGSGDPFNELSTIAWKSWHVPKVLNADWLIAIETAAEDLT